MAERVFREFVRFAGRHWKSRFGDVRRISKALGSVLPAASTFDFGLTEQTGQPLFVHLQDRWQPIATRRERPAILG